MEYKFIANKYYGKLDPERMLWCPLLLGRHSQGSETLWAWEVCLDNKIVTVTSSWLKAACLFLVFSYALDIAQMLKNIYHPCSCFQRGRDLLFSAWEGSMEGGHLLSFPCWGGDGSYGEWAPGIPEPYLTRRQDYVSQVPGAQLVALLGLLAIRQPVTSLSPPVPRL